MREILIFLGFILLNREDIEAIEILSKTQNNQCKENQ